MLFAALFVPYEIKYPVAFEIEAQEILLEIETSVALFNGEVKFVQTGITTSVSKLSIAQPIAFPVELYGVITT